MSRSTIAGNLNRKLGYVLLMYKHDMESRERKDDNKFTEELNRLSDFLDAWSGKEVKERPK